MKYMDAVNIDKELCSLIAMEECGELIQAISKAKRGKLDKDNMAEEISDVFICINWICEIYGISQDDINLWMKLKQNRIVERLNNGEFK